MSDPPRLLQPGTRPPVNTPQCTQWPVEEVRWALCVRGGRLAADRPAADRVRQIACMGCPRATQPLVPSTPPPQAAYRLLSASWELHTQQLSQVRRAWASRPRCSTHHRQAAGPAQCTPAAARLLTSTPGASSINPWRVRRGGRLRQVMSEVNTDFLVVGIAGAQGCGKSTLANALCGLGGNSGGGGGGAPSIAGGQPPAAQCHASQAAAGQHCTSGLQIRVSTAANRCRKGSGARSSWHARAGKLPPPPRPLTTHATSGFQTQHWASLSACR